MTKPLPQRDVEARATRSGRPRLTHAERRALRGIKDEALKAVIAELLISTRESQENFQTIEQWFPIQPADLAKGIENQSESDESRFWLRWWRKGKKRAASTIRGWVSALGYHELRLEVRGQRESGGDPEHEDATQQTSIRLFVKDGESNNTGIQLVVAGGSRYLLRQEPGGHVSDFLEVASRRQLPTGSLVKGALITADGVDLPRILPVGENGKLLVADSTVERGLKWKTPEEAGLKGLEGRWAGVKYAFSTNTEATDPGAGKFKFDKAFAEATTLRISETDKDGNALAAFLATIDDSSSAIKGQLVVRKIGEPKVFAIYNLTGGLLDNGTWDSIGIAFLAGSGLANNDEVMLEFYRTGDKGDQGEKGEKGEAGAKGEKGEAGAAGAEGRAPGLHYTWLTNTEVTDPGSGKAKRSNTNSALRISETDKDGNGVAPFLATWDDSTTTTNRGTILVRQVGSPKRFRILKITGALTDEGAWDSIPTELIAEGEALENEKEVAIEWFRTGDRGEKGEKGETGTGLTGEAEEDLQGSWPKLLIRNLKVTTAKIAENAVNGTKIKMGNAEKISWFKEATEKAFLFANENYIELAHREAGEKRASFIALFSAGKAALEAVILKSAEAEIRRVIFNEEEKSHFQQLSSVRKQTDYGRVEALPGSPSVGDTCSFLADKTNGIVWRLEYDGEGTWPWKKIGGPPMYTRIDKEVAFKTEAYVAVAEPLKLTAPLAMEAHVEIAAQCRPGAVESASIRLSYSVGATAASDVWAILNQTDKAGFQFMTLSRRRRQEIAKGAVLEEKGKIGFGAEGFVSERYLSIDPIRVG